MSTLYAETANGVHLRGDDDFVTETVDEKTFIASLPALSDDEYIKCDTISDEAYAAIEAEYGIH